MDYEAEYNKLKTQFDELKGESRKWEERSKSNYQELQDAQAVIEERDKELETANSRISELSELESVNSDLQSKLDAIKQEKAHAELISEVAKESGVDASVLRGTTKEELEAHAESLKSVFRPSAPVVKGQADVPGETPADPEREAVRGLFGNE